MTNWMYQKYVVKRFIDCGYHVYTSDHIGHGRSDGLYGLINNYNDLVDDAMQHIKHVRTLYDKSVKLFIECESMGGAMAITIAIRESNLVDGIVLQAPMAIISESVRPPQSVVSVLTSISKYMPTAAVTPGNDLGMCITIDYQLNSVVI